MRRLLSAIRGAVRPGVLVAGSVASSAIVVAVAIATGGGGGGGSSQGTFDCYGTTGCSSLPAAATCTVGPISSGLQSALNSATGGEVICLNSGSYGDIALTSKTYSSVVTVQPASGAAAVIGGVTLNAVARLRITGVGGGGSTMSVGGSQIDASNGCSSNITFNYVTYTSGAFTHPKFSCSSAMNILYDHDRFDNISGVNEGEELRFRVIDTGGGPSSADGITVSNSHFAGGCSDGVDFAGDPYGTVVGPGNEFTNIDQSYSDANCTPPGQAGPNHVDPIQGLGSDHTLVTGNWFHDNGSGSGGILSNVEPNLTVTNNVFASTGYAHSILVKGAQNNTITHNYMVGDIDWQPANGGGASGFGNVVRNNVFTGSGINLDGSSTTYTADHNMSTPCIGCDTAGPATLVSSPASGYYHYQLATGSAGYHAGSDGLSLGIVP